MRSHCHCPKEGNLPDVRFESVTKADFPVPSTLKPQPIMNQYRTLTFCTPLVDTGGSLQAPMGLSCHTQPLFTAGELAPDMTSGALASSLPCSWTTPPGAGVEPGEHLTYKSAAIIHQDICRDGHPVPGRMCAASRMVARDQLEKIAARYGPKDKLQKMSTPSGHR